VDNLAVTKAHIKASNKYNKENYRQLKANVRPDDYNLIDNYCNNTKISKAQLIVNACKEYIGNHLIKDKKEETRNREEGPTPKKSAPKKTPIKLRLKKKGNKKNLNANEDN